MAPLIHVAYAIASPQYSIPVIISKTTDVVRQIVVVLFILAVVVFAWGIVKMISAAGNTEKVKQAKGILWWGIIGMFVLATIGGIIAFLQSELGITGIQETIKAPQF